MATWSGWVSELLHAAGIVNTPPNQRFMNEWASHAQTDCRNNPVDLAIQSPGSSQCGRLPGILARAQNYDTHARAATAFDTEVHMDFAKAILHALDSGNPFQVSNWNDVVSALGSWGSDHFANWYFNQMQGSGSGGGGGPTGIAPRTHHAWVDLQRSINKRLPAALRQAEAANRATLRALSRAHKVHH